MELLGLVAQAKSMGLEIGQLLNMLIVYGLVCRKFDKKFDVLIKTIEADKKANDERFEKIESHIGIQKLKEI